MRKLHLKSEDSGQTELLFDTHDYGRNKDHDWRIYIKTKQFVSVGHSDYSVFDDKGPRVDNTAQVTTEVCLYGLNLKDLERLEKWLAAAKEEYMKRSKLKEQGE